MTARIIDGKAIATELSQRIADAVKRVTEEHDIEPGLAVVLVGDNPASEIYVRSKTAKTAATNMRSLFNKLPAMAPASELFELIERLNNDPTVHGILVQLPLPPQIDSRKVIEAIAPAKDVDGFHPLTAGLLSTGLPGIVYAAPNAKLVDHGSGSAEDTHVPLVVVDPRRQGGETLGCSVSLRQVAPTILQALGLKPRSLDAVRLEGTKRLPDDANCD